MRFVMLIIVVSTGCSYEPLGIDVSDLGEVKVDGRLLEPGLRCTELSTGTEVLGSLERKNDDSFVVRTPDPTLSVALIRKVVNTNGTVLGTTREPCGSGCRTGASAIGRGVRLSFGHEERPPLSSWQLVSLTDDVMSRSFVDIPTTRERGFGSVAFNEDLAEFLLVWPNDGTVMMQRRRRDGSVVATSQLATGALPPNALAWTSRGYAVLGASSLRLHEDDGALIHEYPLRGWPTGGVARSFDARVATVVSTNAGLEFAEVHVVTGDMKSVALPQAESDARLTWDVAGDVWRIAYTARTGLLAVATVSRDGQLVQGKSCAVQARPGSVVMAGKSLIISARPPMSAFNDSVVRVDF